MGFLILFRGSRFSESNSPEPLQGWDCRMSVTIVAFIVKLVIVTVVVLGAGDIGDLCDEGVVAATLGHSLEGTAGRGRAPGKEARYAP